MKITKGSYLTSSPDLKSSPVHDKFEIAFIGRSNVGKSSLINAIVNHKGLAKTSSTPGKTKLINFFEISSDAGDFMLVDLPGYGYAKTSKSNRQMWVDSSSQFLAKRNNLKKIFVLVDFRHKPQEIDMEFIRWAVNNDLPVSVIATKSDKLNQKETANQTRLFNEFHPLLGLENPLVISSAQTGKGIDQIRNLISDILLNKVD